MDLFELLLLHVKVVILGFHFDYFVPKQVKDLLESVGTNSKNCMLFFNN